MGSQFKRRADRVIATRPLAPSSVALSNLCRCPRHTLLALILLFVNPLAVVHGQTPSTGALTGIAFDPSGAAVKGMAVRLIREDVAQERSMTTNENGQFTFRLLSPGTYELQAEKADFRTLILRELHVNVTETLRLDI